MVQKIKTQFLDYSSCKSNLESRLTLLKNSKDKLALSNYVSSIKPDTSRRLFAKLRLGTLPLEIEIPNNIRDFNLGLMFRESLDTNSGMLFIFDDVQQQSFHMTETKIPLDIAFIREDGTIESIKELEPFDENPVFSEGEVLCALEVNLSLIHI